MKSRDIRFVRFVPVAAILAGVFAINANGQQPAKAEVKTVKGNATSSVGGGPAQPLKLGDALPAGTVVKTGPGAYADLFLGDSAGLVRVLENSTLTVERFTIMDTGAETAVDVQLNLPEGVLLGTTRKISAASKYEVKLPTGIAGIRGTRWRMSSNGTVVLLDGSLIYVDAPPGENPVANPMMAPPAVFFQRGKGVQPAPDYLVNEVNGQLAGLPGGAVTPKATGLEEPPPGSEPYIYVTPVKPKE